MDELARRTDGTLATEHLVDSARAFAAASRSQNTRRAYRAALRAFVRWAESQEYDSFPAAPATVALYITHLAEAGRKAATIELGLAAISEAHKAKGLESPRSSGIVQQVRRGVRRRLGVAQKAKAPITASELREMLNVLPEGLLGLRDRALLLVGFAGAFRRSELVALDVDDVTFMDDGVEVALRRSKTDQEGEGRKVGLPFGSTPQTCPVRSLKAWLGAAEITEGPIFRPVNRHGRVAAARLSSKAVALVVKRRAVAAGMDASVFAGHSLRAGLATAAAKAGKSERAIMQQTGHRSVTMVRRYIRDGSLFAENAAAGLL